MPERFRHFSFDPAALLDGHEVRLLHRGPDLEAAILRLIEGARHRIQVVIYHFGADAAGQRVRDALIRACRRGCAVQVLYDAVGSVFSSAAFFEPLADAGAEVREYNPLWPIQWKWISKRNHRKMVFADSRTVLVGGFNFSDDYFLLPEEGGCFDLAFELEGPARAQAFDYFQQAWRERARGRLRSLPERWKERRAMKRQRQSGHKRVQVVGNDHFADRWRIRREILYAIEHARAAVDVMNPYFLPDPAIVRALVQAVERGLRVRVLVPASSDVRLVDLASKVVFRKLAKRGVEIWRWPGFLHAKAVGLDGEWVSVGSFNFDYRSLLHNLEVMVNVADAELGRQFAALFDAEVSRSRRFGVEDWEALPTYEKWLARILYRLRAFL